jgi:hypothetical protein
MCMCVVFVFFSKKYLCAAILYRENTQARLRLLRLFSFVDMRLKKFKRHNFDCMLMVYFVHICSLKYIHTPLALAQLTS